MWMWIVIDCNPMRWVAVLGAVLFCATVMAADDQDPLSPHEADVAISGEPAATNVRPTLVQEQLQAYARLRQIWSRREVPDGMKPPQAPFRPRNSGVPAVSLLAENVEFRIGAGIGFYIDHLEAALVPRHDQAPVNFDNPWSYTIRIIRGRIVLHPEQLDVLFNHHVLTYTPRPIVEVETSTSKNTLKIELGARLWSVLPPVGALPTTLVGSIKVTADDRLVYTPRRVTSLGLPLLAVLGAVNLKLSALVPFHRPGVTLEGNKLYMDPEILFPPPRFQIDNLRDAELTNQGLVLTFSSKTDPDFAQPPVPADSFMWMQSGDAKFFDVVLVNAHLEVLSADPDKPLVFNLYHYRAQAAAGKIFARRNGALVVKVPGTFPKGIVSAQYPEQPRRSTR